MKGFTQRYLETNRAKASDLRNGTLLPSKATCAVGISKPHSIQSSNRLHVSSGDHGPACLSTHLLAHPPSCLPTCLPPACPPPSRSQILQTGLLLTFVNPVCRIVKCAGSSARMKEPVLSPEGVAGAGRQLSASDSYTQHVPFTLTRGGNSGQPPLRGQGGLWVL